MIEIKSLVKIYEDGEHAGVKAVNDISFKVDEGRFYTLLGPSGCGKTTTLRCIAGLEKANGGEILVAGKKVFSATARHVRARLSSPHRYGFSELSRYLAAYDGMRKRRVSSARGKTENQ